MIVRKLWKVLLYSLAGFALLLAVLLLAIKLALDRVPAYKEELKAWVHTQTGLHIAFSSVRPSLRWYGPELYFADLELRSKDDRRVLARAAGGRIGADVWQLIRSGKLFAARVELIGPDLSITRLGPRSFAIGSELELKARGASAEAFTLDDLPAGTLAIRAGKLTVLNWNAALPQMLLGEVDLVVHRGADSLALQFDARLPQDLGGVLSLTGSASGLADAESLDWRADARARDIAFSGWRLLLPDILHNLSAGKGAFELSASGRGANLLRADLSVDAAGVVSQLNDGAAAKFDRIGGVFTLTHVEDRWRLQGRQVRALRAGRKDPESQFGIDWRAGESGLLELGASASYLRADSLLPLAGLLPQKDIRDRLVEIAPTGEWFDAKLQLRRATPADPWAMRVNARFNDVGFAPVGHTPGVRGLTGSVSGSESGGHVQIDSSTLLLNWPWQWPQPVVLDTLVGKIFWKRDAGELLIATPALDARNPDVALHAQLALHLPTNGDPPRLVLVSELRDGNVANTKFYLPRAVIGPQALKWLDRAFVAGRLSTAKVILQGPLRQFPFRDGSGLFLARAAIDGMVLDYADGWPLIEEMRGEAVFRNESLTVEIGGAKTNGLPIAGGEAKFADFKTGELDIHATAAGDAAGAIAYLTASPVNAMADNAFTGVEASGELQTKIELFLPFKDFEHRKILVDSHLNGVTVHRQGLPLTGSELVGDLDIDGGHVARADIRGRLLGGAVRVQGRAPRKRPLTRTQLDIRGNFTGDAAQAALGLPANHTLKGLGDWHATLVMANAPARERTLRVSSSLAGLESRLPEPLAKPYGRPLPLTLEIEWPPEAGMQVSVGLGGVVRSAFVLAPGVYGEHIARAALTFGGAAPAFSDDQIVNIAGRVEHLNMDDWLALLTGDKSGKPLSYYLKSAHLDAGEVDYLGLSFRTVALDLADVSEHWRLAVDGPSIAGTVVWPAAADSGEAWDLAFTRLRVDDQDAPAGRTPAGPPAAPAADDPDGGAAPAAAPAAAFTLSVSPRSVPALKFHADDLSWGDRHLGKVDAVVAKLADGVTLDHLTVTSPSFGISAQGDWRGADAGTGHLTGSLTSTDVKTTLTQLGYAEVITARAGKLDFDLKWTGAPSADAFRDASGHVGISLDRGQVLGIKPGAGRVLGLASIAELPRRLTLDFSDLTDKGLAFDTVRGDFKMRGGNAETDNVLLKGPAAEIGLIGRVGLKNKDYDQIAVVTGSVGNSLPIAAALAGGPVIGGAVLLFSQVFKQPLRGLARGYYRITGAWDNPTVERIKSADAAKATAEGQK
jgi:uncharacterized protein (TIGR02099 family)